MIRTLLFFAGVVMTPSAGPRHDVLQHLRVALQNTAIAQGKFSTSQANEILLGVPTKKEYKASPSTYIYDLNDDRGDLQFQVVVMCKSRTTCGKYHLELVFAGTREYSLPDMGAIFGRQFKPTTVSVPDNSTVSALGYQSDHVKGQPNFTVMMRPSGAVYSITVWRD